MALGERSARDRWGQRQRGRCKLRVFDRGTFWVLPLTYSYIPKKYQGVPFSPICQNIVFLHRPHWCWPHLSATKARASGRLLPIRRGEGSDVCDALVRSWGLGWSGACSLIWPRTEHVDSEPGFRVVWNLFADLTADRIRRSWARVWGALEPVHGFDRGPIDALRRCPTAPTCGVAGLLVRFPLPTTSLWRQRVCCLSRCNAETMLHSAETAQDIPIPAHSSKKVWTRVV